MANPGAMLNTLPNLPSLDASTQALFEAIARRDARGVNEALAQGAKLDQVEPFRLGHAGNDIEGGLLPLQAVCSVSPQKPLAMEILATLLAGGANPNATGMEDAGGTPLSLLAQRLPQNAPSGIELLVQHGAEPTIDMVMQALTAQRSWVDWKKPVQYCEATLDALWKTLPETERIKLTPEWIMKVVPNSSEPLDYGQIKRVQWLSNHCMGTPQLKDRLADRRAEHEAARPATTSAKLH